MNVTLALLLALVGYLLGSLPVGYLLGRALRGIDIRNYGSGSTGATNVLRVLGRGPGSLALALDVVKGLAAALLARALGAEPWLVVLTALMAIVGHSRPVWLGFRGGKSVAVSIGLLFGMHLPVALCVFAIWATAFALTRIVSVGSIAGALAAPLWFVLWGAPLPYVLFGLAGGVYVVWRHRGNIERLVKGTEPRVGSSVVR
jgi:glycerol-3-phosphate acyltransferase PlsY